jgi:hypothetical protein
MAEKKLCPSCLRPYIRVEELKNPQRLCYVHDEYVVDDVDNRRVCSVKQGDTIRGVQMGSKPDWGLES